MPVKARYGKKRKKKLEEQIEEARKKADSDAYLFDVEYEKLRAEQEAAQREIEQAREELQRITEELRQEMYDGTASEADMARFMAVLTDRGAQLQKQQEKMREEMDSLYEQRAEIDQRMAELRVKAFSGSTNAYVSADKNDYKGFDAERGGTKAKVVEMRPEEYLRRVAYQFTGNGMEAMLKGMSPAAVERYAKAMLRGTKYKAPSLNYKGQQTSGAEKALAALLNGYSKIPVLVVE